MPTALRLGPYRLFFYPADGVEPRHVHISRDGAEAKFWLDPVVLAHNHRFPASDLRTVKKLVEVHSQTIRDAWDEFFNS